MITGEISFIFKLKTTIPFERNKKFPQKWLVKKSKLVWRKKTHFEHKYSVIFVSEVGTKKRSGSWLIFLHLKNPRPNVIVLWFTIFKFLNPLKVVSWSTLNNLFSKTAENLLRNCLGRILAKDAAYTYEATLWIFWCLSLSSYEATLMLPSRVRIGSSLNFGALWELFECSLINLRALGTIWELFQLWMWHNFSSWNESYEKRNQIKSKVNFSQDVFANYWKSIAE